jgi:hypothetical protein
MSMLTREIGDERDALLGFLDAQREGLRLAARGLTEEQATARPTASALCVGGLVKHAALMEDGWVRLLVDLPRLPRDWDTEFRFLDGETLAGLLAKYDEVAKETEHVVADLDLDRTYNIGAGSKWLPDPTPRSARWVLLHLIEETARHAGHADIIRESLDGETWHSLAAAAASG